jgi:hypothetical protein
MRRLLLGLLAAAALPAAAQVPVAVNQESPRWGSFQVSISPYSPNIDSEFGGTAYPYGEAFGSSRPLMVQGIFNRSAWVESYGSLDIGFGLGYWQNDGVAIYKAGGVTQTGGKTSLSVLPLTLSLGYRLDLFWRWWGVPFAPYVRGQIMDYIWWSSGQNGTSTYLTNGTVYRASGATFGYSGTLGLALVLDFFDPTLARQMDYDVGINSTMLFFDFTKGSVNDFGSKNSWQLAAGYWQWSIGLLFVF